MWEEICTMERKSLHLRLRQWWLSSVSPMCKHAMLTVAYRRSNVDFKASQSHQQPFALRTREVPPKADTFKLENACSLFSLLCLLAPSADVLGTTINGHHAVMLMETIWDVALSTSSSGRPESQCANGVRDHGFVRQVKFLATTPRGLLYICVGWQIVYTCVYYIRVLGW